MGQIPSDIKKWNKRWRTEVKYCRPSEGGAVGVIFVWTQDNKWINADGSQGKWVPKDATFVIKPIQGTAAAPKFAEHILSKIAGAKSTNSRAVEKGSICAKGIIDMLVRFSGNETNPTIKARWNSILGHYQSADTLMIQETQKSILELGDFYKPEEYKNGGDGLEKVLTNQILMINLGKLFAADALIGNGDRLSGMNTGNIAFDESGNILAIDSTTILTNYNTIINDNTYLVTGLVAKQPQHWVDAHIHQSAYNANPSVSQQKNYDDKAPKPVLPPGVGIQEVFNIKQWWDNKFRKELEYKLNQHCPNESSPPDNVWFQAELWFTSGVNQGIQHIDSKLSGFDWFGMKRTYNYYVKKYGGDPNLDWMNFKVRRRYIKLRRKGLDDTQALAAIQDYVANRMPGL